MLLVTLGFAIFGLNGPMVEVFNIFEMSDVVDIKFENLSEK